MSGRLLDWNGSALKKRTCKSVDEKIARLSQAEADTVTRLLLCANGTLLPVSREEEKKKEKKRKTNNTNTGLEALPERVAVLKKLALLDLFKNKLSTLPGSLSSLAFLTHLNLSENRPLVVLPDCVTALRSLVSLHATNCRLRELPEGLGQLKTLTEYFLSPSLPLFSLLRSLFFVLLPAVLFFLFPFLLLSFVFFFASRPKSLSCKAFKVIDTTVGVNLIPPLWCICFVF